MKDVFYTYLAKKLGYLPTNNCVNQTPLLTNILQHSLGNIPYYRKLFVEHEIANNGKINLERFSSIPFLTKDILRSNSQELIADNIDKKSTYWNNSGGSTGEPVRFLQDKRYLRATRAITYEQERWTGYRLGDPIIHVWGDEREVIKGSQSLKAKLTNYIKNRTLLNSFRMSREARYDYIRTINRTQPSLIKSYAQSMYELCKFAEEENLEISGVGAVMTSAGTLYPFMRETIERVCQTKVFNHYGSREVGAIACECEKQEGLHVASQGIYVEIVDPNGKPCPPNVEGEIIVTSLINYAMPFIRYRIGDFGSISNSCCSCGRPGLLLKKVSGRVTDVFKASLGKIVPAEYFIHIIGVVQNKGAIKKFQVIQKKLNVILIKIVKDNTLEDRELDDIKTKLQLVMGTDCQFEFEFVEEIPPLASGKYRYTIREIE